MAPGLSGAIVAIDTPRLTGSGDPAVLSVVVLWHGRGVQERRRFHEFRHGRTVAA
jgi:hypothetical protein